MARRPKPGCSANGDTLIICVWIDAPYPWADDAQGSFSEAGSALCSLHRMGKGAGGAEGGLWVQRGLGGAGSIRKSCLASLDGPKGHWGLFPPSGVGHACGQGMW